MYADIDVRQPRIIFPSDEGLGRANIVWAHRSTDDARLDATYSMLNQLSTRPAPHQEMLMRMFVNALPTKGPKGPFKEVSK